jgi:uncharacterized protein YycO
MDIKLQFSSSNSVGSRLIRWRDWSDYSHVDLVLPDGKLLGALPDGGVQIRDPYPTRSKLILSIEVSPDKYHSILFRALSQVGKPYDYVGILGFVFNRDWEDDSKWFCSELIAWLFKECGVPILRTDNTDRISTKDLMLSPYLRG